MVSALSVKVEPAPERSNHVQYRKLATHQRRGTAAPAGQRRDPVTPPLNGERPPAGRRPTRRRPGAHLLGGLALVATLAWLGQRQFAAPWAMGQTAGRTCTVVRIRDGDSLDLRCGGETVEVRLHCIDAPEWEQGAWAKQSLRHLRRITPRRVLLEKVDTDRFGRTVANLYATGAQPRLLNLEQVTSGQAAVYRHYCDDPRFERAEQTARAAGLGIWSRPGAQQTPWEFRHRQGR
ncbi:hypothetical protein THSYN_28085 [Candidatus Thiodictyon syntrophicum]|jgi:endonuclease YncB( thermonuclease family)|uniref:TNase-like domain-containing protein n=1 Tax=Candidatus Thiodictyon syntrophicum TaxID=1166950 RepID=A0A2K8UFS8_9GAMM|nr:hypothetical protein THSYN_28085 [Candidatus Thiodictyon syntrophicum]